MDTGGGDGADLPSSNGESSFPGGGGAARGRGMYRRTHARSASHGGTLWAGTVDSPAPYSPFDNRNRFNYMGGAGTAAAGSIAHESTSPLVSLTGNSSVTPEASALIDSQSTTAATVVPKQSILVNTSEGQPSRGGRTHHRTFSHGQTIDGVTGPYQRGHRRAGSKTDFILPDGHEQRERQRQQAAAKPALGRTSSFPLGHKRNTSKTESIYTIRENKISLYQRLLLSFGRSVSLNLI